MKTQFLKKTILLACCLVSCIVAAQGSTVTLILSYHTNNAEEIAFTNEVHVAPYEVFQIKGLYPNAGNSWDWQNTSAVLQKDGESITISPIGGCPPISGPASVKLVSRAAVEPKYIVTYTLTPESFPPDKTIILPPGTNQVAITLESSTNLLHWVAATNGVYGTTNEARFFRIKADRLN
jgi:hypothetical protein